MSFLDGINYSSVNDETIEFREEKLAAITPEDVVGYLNLKAFGTTEPPSDDSCPPLCRSSTLVYYKKAISYFMPCRQPWDEWARQGNPANSTAVNIMVKKIKKYEVHHRN